MKLKLSKFHLYTIACILLTSGWICAQQQDVPEPVFVNFSIQPPYIPNYHGRDPFKPLDWIANQTRLSISELEYHGIVVFGGTSMALFGWRTNQMLRYTLKNRKLYSDSDIPVDGVVGDITETQVVLIQGNQKIVYPRK